MSILRSLDPNFASRKLRDLMLEIVDEHDDRGKPVPHSFDRETLLGYSRKLLGRRDIQHETDIHLALLSRAGIAHALLGREGTAVDLFKRGYRISDNNQLKAVFSYNMGHHYHQRRGEMLEARAELQEAYELSERSRRLRTETLLALGTVEMNLDLHEAAMQSLEAARDLHVRDLEPHALMRQAIVLTKQGEFADAEHLNRKSHTLFRRHRDWLGMNVADGNLGVLLLEKGAPGRARKILDRVVTEQTRVLDLVRLGRSYNNLSVACSRQGDHIAARDSLLRAIQFNSATGRQRLLAGNYRNLGRCLSDLRDLDGSLAAFDRSLDFARSLKDVGFEFEILTDLIGVAIKHRVSESVLSRLLHRCFDILDTDPDVLTKEHLVDFGRMTRDVIAGQKPVTLRGRRGTAGPRLTSRDGRSALDRLLPGEKEWDFEGMLSRRLGEGLAGSYVPPVDAIRRFLMLYTGDYFKSGNYTREFDLTQERAKRHLRWLCGERVIERYGSRKASRYALAFHR